MKNVELGVVHCVVVSSCVSWRVLPEDRIEVLTFRALFNQQHLPVYHTQNDSDSDTEDEMELSEEVEMTGHQGQMNEEALREAVKQVLGSIIEAYD